MAVLCLLGGGAAHSSAAPSITTPPASQSAECGTTVTFSVVAVGIEPLFYQWYYQGNPLTDETNATLILSAVTPGQAGNYFVRVSDESGSTDSAAAVLGVQDTLPPVLSLPANIVITRTTPSEAVVNYSASAVDSCAGALTPVCSPNSGSSFAVGVTTVNCSVSDPSGNTASGSFTVTVQSGFTYTDPELLLVLRKSGYNDLLFNLGSVSNYLGQAAGTITPINNWNISRVTANFGSDLTGVKYVLLAVTTPDDPLLRAWVSDGASLSVPQDETRSKWSTQWSIIDGVGTKAMPYFYPAATNQSVSLSPSDPNSYTYIASAGGTLDPTTLGGAVPFQVEQDLSSPVRFIELKVSAESPKPISTEVGSFLLTPEGSLTFTSGVLPPVLTGPVSQSAECGSTVTLSVSASGSPPLSYQWYVSWPVVIPEDPGPFPIPGEMSSTLVINPVTLDQTGFYSVVVSNPGGSTTSVVATVTVQDTLAPIVTVPSDIVVTRTTPSEAVVNYSASAVDSCAGPLTPDCSPVSGSTFALGVTTVNCSVSDPSGNTANGSFTVTVQSGFTYADPDLLLVLRKSGYNDSLFDLGSVSNYLGQAVGTITPINNWNVSRVTANFGSDLTGIKYVLLAVTTPDDLLLRAWLSDSAPLSVPQDETRSKWSTQWSIIDGVGTKAMPYFYPAATNQSVSLPPSDPNSYTYIASGGGTLDVTTLGGAVPFPVEQDLSSGVRFIELKVSTESPKPISTEVGSFLLTPEGNLTFTSGVLPPELTGPVGQSAECGSTVTLTVSASGSPPFTYQWYTGNDPLAGETSSTLVFAPISIGNAGNYSVVVSNPGGSTTSVVATVTVQDTLAPVITVPANFTVLRTNEAGAVATFTSTAVDQCDGMVGVSCTPASGTMFAPGTNVVSCVATDSHGNTGSNGFIVRVLDTYETVLMADANTYYQFNTNLAPGTAVYLDADPTTESPLRAMQRSLGYREVDYKSLLFQTLFFSPVTPTTNGATIAYDYTAQNNTTNVVGYWVNKDLPVNVGPDGLAYISDGHHTTAGYMSSDDPVRLVLPNQNRTVLGHVAANFFNPGTGITPVDDSWWLARASEGTAYLYGPLGDHLMVSTDSGYSGLQPILPSVQPMPTTPSTLGAGAMEHDHYRSLAWGLVDGIVASGNNGAGAKISGFSKKGLSGLEVLFVEFYWADYLRNRIIWDDTKTGSPLGSGNGDANAIKAPLSFFAAVANGIALAKSEVYRDQFGRRVIDYTDSALFDSNTIYWAYSSLSNKLAAASNTFNLYLLDDSTIAGDITPSSLSTNILHIDTAAGMIVTNTVQNIQTLIINAGGNLATSWKDKTVTNSILTVPAGNGVVTLSGNMSVSTSTIVSNGTLAVNGTLGNGAVTVAQGVLGGTGTINGSVTVLADGALNPGGSIGTLTINGALNLAGTTVMELRKDGAALTSDQVRGLTSVSYGGALTLLASGDALAAGDHFQLFTSSVYTGAFAAMNLPTLSGDLAWDTTGLALDGTIRVITVTHPQFAAPVYLPEGLVLSGQDGVPGRTYYVLSSTNVSLPFNQWTPVCTNVFDLQGRFSVTNPVSPLEPHRFYLLNAP